MLLALGFKLDGVAFVLPADRNILPADLDFVMNMRDRKNELRQREQEEWVKQKAAKDAEKDVLRLRMANDRKEAAQRSAVASRSKLVPFSGAPKVGCSDIGIGKNEGG